MSVGACCWDEWERFIPHVCLSLPSVWKGIDVVVVVFLKAALCICLHVCAVAELHRFRLTLQPLRQQKTHAQCRLRTSVFLYIQRRWLTSFPASVCAYLRKKPYCDFPDCVWFCECVDSRRGVGLIDKPCFMHERAKGGAPLGGLMSVDTHNSLISWHLDYLAEMHKKAPIGTVPPFFFFFYSFVLQVQFCFFLHIPSVPSTTGQYKQQCACMRACVRFNVRLYPKNAGSLSSQ